MKLAAVLFILIFGIVGLASFFEARPKDFTCTNGLSIVEVKSKWREIQITDSTCKDYLGYGWELHRKKLK